MPVEDVIDQLRGIRCPSPIWQDGELILSCSDAIAKVIENHCFKKDQPKLFENGNGGGEAEKEKFVHELAVKQPGEEAVNKKTIATCPDCGSTLEHKEGCLLCSVCGFSKCG